MDQRVTPPSEDAIYELADLPDEPQGTKGVPIGLAFVDTTAPPARGAAPVPAAPAPAAAKAAPVAPAPTNGASVPASAKPGLFARLSGRLKGEDQPPAPAEATQGAAGNGASAPPPPGGPALRAKKRRK